MQSGRFIGLVTTLLLCSTIVLLGSAALVGAQPARPAPEAPEIKLDEQTTLKATALEARMAAIVALLQRQAQDMQQELKQILEDRKKLIEDAAKKSRTDVGDANEWMFDNKGQRYVKIKRAP
jgi:small-conductance mechanosensitive channel